MYAGFGLTFAAHSMGQIDTMTFTTDDITASAARAAIPPLAPGEKKTVVVAMSGGVDSAVTALLLRDAGYNVIGITMHLYSGDETGAIAHGAGSCCGLEGVEDARAICQVLGVPFYPLNFERQFEQHVIAPFADAYAAGRTPNPCLNCNRHLKFAALLGRAIAMGADYLATGHYAIIRRDADGSAHLHRAVDARKDQSSVLYTFTQQQLARTLLPLGTLTKPEVRAIAKANGLPVAEKPESMDICFVPDGDYARIVAERRPEAFTPGNIVDRSGTVVGQHRGIGHYTVGQRRGLHIAQGERRYVVGLRARTNEVVIGDADDLTAYALVADDVQFIAGPAPAAESAVEAMVRYRSTPVPALLTPLADRTARLVFPGGLAQPAATPGQAVVFYRGDEVLGGGTIQRVERRDGSRLPLDIQTGTQPAEALAVIAIDDLAVVGA
jgi:tRNA-specific 2-thiouridylase